ncbi:MAG: sulfite reductase subunit alpha [Euryarchaeota archaeon]|nr:sulfite reductase subunit alpha [Euryarchaeota archaeon]
MAENNDNSLIILFGSQTGNAEELAEETKKIADKAGLDSHVIDMDEFSAALLPQHKRILIITSTWGEGEMPDNAEDLWGDVCSSSPSLNGINFSVCAIGDTSYDEFCKAGIDWDNKLHELGANRTTEIQLCDVDYEPEWQQWVDKAIPAMASLQIPLAQEVDETPVTVEVEVVEEVKVEKSKEKSEWSAKNPYSSNITECYVLNGEGSKKETRHIVFSLGDSGLDYKVGDALGVVPENPPHIVEELLELQGWNRDEMVSTHKGERTLYDALKKDYEVHMANKKFVQSLTEKIVSTGMSISMRIVKRSRDNVKWSSSEEGDLPPGLNSSLPADNPASRVEAIVADSKAIEDYLWTRDYVDIMREFNVKYTPEEFLDLTDRLKPRLYSIASSHDAHPGYVELTVGIVRFNYHDRQRGGLCTQYMADEVVVNETPVGVFMSPTKSFVLPDDLSTDIIMVGPGTGIAPFRAFMEQRVHDKAPGRNWLFFGDQSEKTEYYYKDEIEGWLDGGHLYKFTTAWSRDQEEKIYVQHRLKQNGAEVWEWFENGAYFYICGDKQYMAKDVHRALIEIAMEHGGMSEEDATHFIEKTMMKEQKRYLRDVY